VGDGGLLLRIKALEKVHEGGGNLILSRGQRRESREKKRKDKQLNH
jgi:hypothetical protein